MPKSGINLNYTLWNKYNGANILYKLWEFIQNKKRA